MVSQTTQASASTNNKGFTLVELIVVITILAILGTIGFLSLQGYSGQSRDSKRTADLRSLTTAVTTKSTEGISLISTVNSAVTNNKLALTTAQVGGADSTTADYNAGVPNYTVLGLDATSFKDPLGSEYRMGSSTRANGIFQVAAKLEPAGTNANGVASVKGNYNNRTAVAYTVAGGTGIAGSFTVTGLQSTAVGLFKKGDTVWVNGAGTDGDGTITSVSGDGLSLTITGTSAAGVVSTIALGHTSSLADGNEVAGLIATAAGGTTAITDGQGTNLPY